MYRRSRDPSNPDRRSQTTLVIGGKESHQEVEGDGHPVTVYPLTGSK